MARGFALAIHGGAGGLPRDARVAREMESGLRVALEAGAALLASGGGALDAAVAAVRVLESAPVFNAGRGSVLSASGQVEMDAAVMEGEKRRAGAVACVRRLEHPVEAAREVLRDGRHVVLSGEGAEAFALSAGVRAVDPDSLVTPFRRDQLERAQMPGTESRGGGPGGGTVGAVARDGDGHLAAATSTGGLVGKRPGRVSDSALIGCGTWADDASCAVSATGQGEIFIRTVFAHAVDVAVRAGVPLPEACAGALAEVEGLGGSGGCIALDARGAIAMPFDMPAMARGVVREGSPGWVALAPEDPP
jgi:isoaspartyl peptidase/L-asparaginase-like protein (Ntn-hydrolase superfamily)